VHALHITTRVQNVRGAILSYHSAGRIRDMTQLIVIAHSPLSTLMQSGVSVARRIRFDTPAQSRVLSSSHLSFKHPRLRRPIPGNRGPFKCFPSQGNAKATIFECRKSQSPVQSGKPKLLRVSYRYDTKPIASQTTQQRDIYAPNVFDGLHCPPDRGKRRVRLWPTLKAQHAVANVGVEDAETRLRKQ